ncbi:MAG TPA: archaeosortase/exosortase family protein [Salinivirgaceae bacterium]|nr:archaeosortase/exosortase family protein [Salinivirgaceae bacterium]
MNYSSFQISIILTFGTIYAIEVNIWLKYKDNTVFRFALSFAFGLGLNILSSDFPIISDKVESFITSLNFSTLLTYLTTKHLNLLGIPALIVDNKIVIGEHSTYFDYGCLAIRDIVMFAGFILTYFGRFYKKILYILVGTMVLIVANVSRVTLIGIAMSYDYSLFGFVHDYGTILIVTGVTFLLWAIWSKKNNR